jgi:hypothetical protein
LSEEDQVRPRDSISASVLRKLFIRNLMRLVIVGAINMISLSIDEHLVPHVIVPRYELLGEPVC